MITYEKTWSGTIKTEEDGTQICRRFKFTPEDVGKFIVMKWRYEEHIFWGGPFGTRLIINHNQLNTRNNDLLYGVYQIDWHNDYWKDHKLINYKVKLVPVGDWGAWCPNRSWYTTDMEQHINNDYNLYEENPIFDNEDDANEFALKKNNELYPDKRNSFEKLIETGYIQEINIVTNGTVNIPKECAGYIVYAPQSLGKMISEKHRPLTPLEVLSVKNSKHRNITVSPTDLNRQGKICDRVGICGINYSVYGFCFCAPCFPSLMVSMKNHQYFLHSIPCDLKYLTPDGFEKDVCSICNFAIEDYKSLVNRMPELQSPIFIGKTWQGIITDNISKYQEPDTTWINSVII